MCHVVFLSKVGEFRAHAAEWTANVSAEFKETRRRLSVDIYDKFQRAASIKRKLSAELGLGPGQEMTPGKRTLSVNFVEEHDRERELPALTKNGSLYLNGLTPDFANRTEIAIIERVKWTLPRPEVPVCIKSGEPRDCIIKDEPEVVTPHDGTMEELQFGCRYPLV